MVKARFVRKNPARKVVGRAKFVRKPRLKLKRKPYKRGNPRAILARKRSANGRFA